MALLVMGACEAGPPPEGGGEAASAGPEASQPVLERRTGALSPSSDFVQFSDDGLGAGNVAVTTLPVWEAPTDETLQQELEASASLGGEPSVALPTPEEAAVAQAATLAPDANIQVVVQLPEQPFPGGSAAELDDYQLTTWSEARIKALEPLQAPLVKKLEDMGATDVATFWLVNQVSAHVPAGAVAEIAGWPGATVVLDSDAGGGGVAYSGREGRIAMLTGDFHSHGYDGGSGGRSGGRTRIGVIEHSDNSLLPGTTNWVAHDHVGWRDTPGGPSRLVRQYDCRTSACSVVTYVPAVATHGTAVAWVAAGSIEEGQDPAHPGTGTVNQVMRSGQASEANVYYYLWENCSDLVAALQRATLDGVDIANLSIWAGFHGPSDCEARARTYDCGGVNAAIENAMLNGMLVVACSGNQEEPGQGCNMWYPGWRTDTLAVSNLATNPAATDYNTSVPAQDAPIGFVPVGLGGSTRRFSGIDLSAPGYWSYNFTRGDSGYKTTGYVHGCSFATPAVTGSAALLRDVYYDLGGDYTSAYKLFASMLVLGDTWDSAGNYDMATGVSYYTGFGRLHMHYPSSDNLVAPWQWTVGAQVVYEGVTYSIPVGDPGPEHPDLNQLKWAVTWFEPDMNDVAAIHIYVVDTCDPGGREVEIAADESDDTLMRKRIVLNDSQIGDKCLELRIVGAHVPRGSRTVYSAWYAHSGPTADH